MKNNITICAIGLAALITGLLVWMHIGGNPGYITPNGYSILGTWYGENQDMLIFYEDGTYDSAKLPDGKYRIEKGRLLLVDAYEDETTLDILGDEESCKIIYYLKDVPFLYSREQNTIQKEEDIPTDLYAGTIASIKQVLITEPWESNNHKLFFTDSSYTITTDESETTVPFTFNGYEPMEDGYRVKLLTSDRTPISFDLIMKDDPTFTIKGLYQNEIFSKEVYIVFS